MSTLVNPSTAAIPHQRSPIPWVGHMFGFARNPYQFVARVAAEKGEIAAFTLLGQRIVLLTGDEASEVFYRASDEVLDQAAAYKLMTPIFGEGLVFDAPLARKNQQLKMLMPSLRADAMRHHAHKIVGEVDELMRQWGDSGQMDLVAQMKQLTINTASHCLLGREFRYELSAEFAQIYHDLEQGVNPLAYHFPNLPIPAFKRRDRARARLQQLVGGIVQKRAQQTVKPNDLFQSLIDGAYDDGAKLSDNEITGMLIATIFAGHHTSSGTAAWVLLELLKHPAVMREVLTELDTVLGDQDDLSFQNVRDLVVLDRVLKEVLRLHPPLIILMRQVKQDIAFKQYTIAAGDMVWACPPITHRLPHLFANPEAFDPSRFGPDRHEDKNLMAYQPFGGGHHKCSGNAFAQFQIKAIFAVLLRRYTFELVDPPEHYVDDYTQMIVQPRAPCRVRYQIRSTRAAPPSAQPSAQSAPTAADSATASAAGACPFHSSAPSGARVPTFRVVVDRQLCQGHAMCMNEAPEVFNVDANGQLHILKPELTEQAREQVTRAVRYCPNSALKIVEGPAP